MKKLLLLLLIFLVTGSLVLGQNMLTNPGFEDGETSGIPNGWIGFGQSGANLQLVNDGATAHGGSYWAKCTSTNGGYYLLYQNSFPAKPGDVWELSSFIKDVSPANPGASFAALKISAKNSSGSTFKAWEVYYTDVTSSWTKFSNIQIMPEGTAQLQAVIVVHGADGAPEASYGYDDLNCELIYESPVNPPEANWLANPGFEQGPDTNGVPLGWIGYAQSGASLEMQNNNAGAVNGNYWTKFGSTTTGYYLLWQNSFPAAPGETWRFSAFIKDVSETTPPASYVALKISAKSITGATFLAYEIFQDGVMPYWKKFENVQTMPEGTAYIQAVLVVNPPDGVAAPVYYGFDDVRLTRDTVPPVPVEMVSFAATVSGNNVSLNWQTATELNNRGFEIQRRIENSEFSPVAFIKGSGTTTQHSEYNYTDKNLDKGKYFYRLKQMDFDGKFRYSEITEVNVQVADNFSLNQNYPNPFNPSTTIEYVLPEKTFTKLSVINSLGQEILLLINEEQEKGTHKVELNASNLSSGVYFYKITAGNFTETKKMLLLK